MPNAYSRGIKDPATLNPSFSVFSGNAIRHAGDVFALNATFVVNDKLFIASVPSNAIILPQSSITHDALGAGVTLDIGFDDPITGLSMPAAAPNCLAAALGVATAGTKLGMAAVTLANMKQRVWQLAGFASNPGRILVLTGRITGAAVTGTPRIDFSYLFADER